MVKLHWGEWIAQFIAVIAALYCFPRTIESIIGAMIILICGLVIGHLHWYVMTPEERGEK